MDIISILSDTIAGLLSAVFFGLITYYIVLKPIMNKLDKLNEKVITYKLSTIDIIKDTYEEKIKEIKQRISLLINEIEGIKEHHSFSSEEEYWMYKDILTEKETARDEAYIELDQALNTLMTYLDKIRTDNNR